MRIHHHVADTLFLSAWLILSFAWLARGQEGSASGEIKVEMVEIPAGSFLMPDHIPTFRAVPLGLTDEEAAEWNSHPHETLVTFSTGFRMSRCEIQQSAYRAVMGTNPSHFKGDDRPVEQVSWYEAMEFCRRLTDSHHRTGLLNTEWRYTLPSETQWVYACLAGLEGPYGFEEGEEILDKYAWFRESHDDAASEERQDDESGTHDVGRKLPNSWGLYDMHGNVSEWCRERCFGVSFSAQVIKGGDWNDPAESCHAFDRGCRRPSETDPRQGFRIIAIRNEADQPTDQVLIDEYRELEARKR